MPSALARQVTSGAVLLLIVCASATQTEVANVSGARYDDACWVLIPDCTGQYLSAERGEPAHRVG